MDELNMVDSSRPNLFRGVSTVFGKADYTERERDQLQKARVSQLLSRITKNRTITGWMWLFGFLAMALGLMLYTALDTTETDPEGGRPAIVQVEDFYYPPEEGIVYPTCELGRGFSFLESGQPGNLLDFAFLSAISYETQKVAQVWNVFVVCRKWSCMNHRFAHRPIVSPRRLVWAQRNGR